MSFVIFKNVTATKECAISKEDLKDQPFFRDVLNEFLFWIDDMVKLAKKKHGKSFVPGKMPVYRTVIYSSIINKIVSFPLGGSLCTCYLFTIYMGKLVGCRFGQRVNKT